MAVIVSTTTHIGDWQSNLADCTISIDCENNLQEIHWNLLKGVILLVGKEVNHRYSGPPEELLPLVAHVCKEYDFPLLIEADGSKMRPLKAPGLHEPVIPEFIENVVTVAGLSGVRKPLTSEWVHRPEYFAELSQITLGEEITERGLANVLINAQGGLKNIPGDAKRFCLVNQADNLSQQASGRTIAEFIKSEYQSVVIASLMNQGQGELVTNINQRDDEVSAVVENIAGIILAAGSASRFGNPKQLLLWDGETFIRQITSTALNSGLNPVIVVTGSSSDDVSSVITDLPLRIVNNSEWEQGISTSIRKGLSAITEPVGGAIFFQADQPQTPVELVQLLVQTHQQGLESIIAPRINGQRGNPVLFDKRTFDQLNTLKGDVGGRAIFSNFPIKWVDCQDPDQLLDIDTPAEYKEFLTKYQGRIKKK
jgi:molybdenum cofactor cytidylyltransferase